MIIHYYYDYYTVQPSIITIIFIISFMGHSLRTGETPWSRLGVKRNNYLRDFPLRAAHLAELARRTRAEDRASSPGHRDMVPSGNTKESDTYYNRLARPLRKYDAHRPRSVSSVA